MKIKYLFCLIMALLISMSFGINVSADNLTDFEKESISLRYTYTSSASSKLAITSNTATCESKLSGYTSVTKIIVSQTLEKKWLLGWSEVASWEKTINFSSASASNTKSNLSSGKYRLKTVFKVYSGSSYETVEKYSLEVMT